MNNAPRTWFDAIAAMAFAGICAGMIGVLNRVGDVSHVVVRLETQIIDMKSQMAKADSYESRISALEAKIKVIQEQDP